MYKYILRHGLLFVLVCSTNLWASNYVIFNQIMYDSPANEWVVFPPYSNGEFMELYNGSETSVSLLGWSISSISPTEHFDFPDISIPSKGFVQIAFRHEDSPSFTLDSIFSSPYVIQNSHVIYQHNVVLANHGDTITLYNAAHEIADQIYYDGTSHLTKPDRLSANNDNVTSGNQCVSLHRTWVEFDEEGKVVLGTSQWKTDKVTFDTCFLKEPVFGEHYLIGDQSLPTGENYIISITPIDPTTRVSITDNGISVSNGVRTQTAIQYYDGLGRPVEMTVLGVTPDKEDLVQITDYSGLHRATQQWLPVPAQTEGQFLSVSDIKTQAQTYYSDNRPFAETLYENSALERVVGQKKQGDTWSSHPTATTYAMNNDSDNVRIYTIAQGGSLKATGENYATHTLYKITTADEDGKLETVYMDKLGRTIAEERAGNRVYYVYDDLNRLRYVLPHISPSKLANGEYALSDTTLRAAAYCYKYDVQSNVIYKRLPGCEPQYMVYDKIGQLILKQDGNQRAKNKWTVYTYDSIGRNLYTAELLSHQSHEYYLSYFADRWYVEHYGNNPSNISIAGTGYASSIFPKNNLRLLTINYYDNYDYLSRLSTPMRQAIRFAQESGYGLQHENATGMLTGTRIYNLFDNEYTAVSYYYDTQGRIVQSRSVRSADNYKTAVSSEYHFDGSVAQQLTVQGTDSNLVSEHYKYDYDHAGRAKSVRYQLNNDDEITLSSFSYDSIGRLAQNLLHNNRDTITYTYDMRNMLTETKNGHFSEKLYYADIPSNEIPNAIKCYNGNIAVTCAGSEEYGFHTFWNTYDEQNRLISSYSYSGSSGEHFSYDNAGNIISLRRQYSSNRYDDLTFHYGNDGHQLLSVTDEGYDADYHDYIEYIDLNKNGEDMSYDANGNLVRDLDRDISIIKYNILNLPDTIQFINGHQIVNLYDARGRKYKSIIYTNICPATTYHNEIAHYTFDIDTVNYRIVEYNDNVIQITQKEYNVTLSEQTIYNATGYFRNGVFYHYIKDHIGNNCAVVNSVTNEVVQSVIYFASGVPIPLPENIEEQPYLYNGKEFIEAHGLNEYDSQARMYYATIMRTTTMDPHAEDYYHLSPYAWCGNNPVNAIDPNGCDTVSVRYNSETNHWDLGSPTIAKGNDVINVTGKDGNTSSYEFSEGEYGKRVNMLNLENTGEGKAGYVLGVYHVSGAEEGGTGFYVTPGGEASNEKESGRRTKEGTYPITVPHDKAEWRYPGVGGKAAARGNRFHYGYPNPRGWSKGCFILFYDYKLVRGIIEVTELSSRTAAINFAHLMGGVGAVDYSFVGSDGNVRNRIGVSWYPYGINNKLVLKSR